jgi:P27 family predicted phage terminase small subunit
MNTGAKGSGKHWTKQEKENREKAEESVRRKGPIKLRAPEWLSPEARKIWDQVKRRLKGIELLDNLDTEMLAVYCDAVSQYRQLSKKQITLVYDEEYKKPLLTIDDIKALQAWARIISQMADKLGLSPNGRARLAKKKAQKEADDFGDEFDS